MADNNGGYGGGPYGGGPYGGGPAQQQPVPTLPFPGFVSTVLPSPTNVLLGNVPISNFSGEPESGLLAGSDGLLFFSPSLLEARSGNNIDIDYIRFITRAHEVYFPIVVESHSQFTYGPFSDSRTNNAKWRTLAEPQVIAVLVNTVQLIALANDIKTQYELHRASFIFHPVPDVFNVVTAPAAFDLASSITLLNDIKVKFNAHLIQPGVHVNNDSANISTAANASDSASSGRLASDLRAKYERHRTMPIVHSVPDVVFIVTAPNSITIINIR